MGGMGDAAPFTERQMISLNSCSGMRSASAKSMRRDASAPHAFLSFFSSSRMRAATCVNGVSTGVAWNDPYIGDAAASYWLIGGSPKISSIVRSTEHVVYSVLSTDRRFENGLIAS